MTSGAMTPKPSDIRRDNLNKRARKIMIQSGKKIGRLTDAEKKTPSEKSSEAMKKKLKERASRVVVVSDEEFERRVKK